MFSLRSRLLYNQGLISLYFLIVRANSSPLDGGVHVMALAPALMVSRMLSSVGPPSNGEIFRDIMAAYRENKPHP